MSLVPVTPGAIDFDRLQALVGQAALTVLEIGANNGADTNRLLETFPGATVYAFEPDPRAIAKFKRNVNNDRARLFECAVGAVDGSSTFHASSGQQNGSETAQTSGMDPARAESWDQSGSLRTPKNHLQIWPWVKFEKDITVPLIALDTFFRQSGLSGIDLIWADAQGAEGDLIKGGQLALSKTRYLYTEYCDHELYEGQITLDQILEQLPAFRLVERFPIDALLENQALKASGGLKAFLKKRLRKALFT